jgi:hypothetical protein
VLKPWQFLVGAFLIGAWIGGPIIWLGSQTHPPAAHHIERVQTSDTRGKPESGQAPQAEGFWERLTTDPVAFFTMMLCTITGGLAVYTGLLWSSTSKLVRGADTNAQHQSRAYVGIVGGAICMTQDRKLFVLLTAKNQGETPAHNVRQFINAEVRDFEDDAPGAMGEVGRDNWVMSPQTTWPLRFPDRPRSTANGFAIAQDFDGHQVMAVEQGERQLVVWGKLSYFDVFDGTEERHSFFCYRNGAAIAVTSMESAQGIEMKWEPEVCPVGNSSS